MIQLVRHLVLVILATSSAFPCTVDARDWPGNPVVRTAAERLSAVSCPPDTSVKMARATLPRLGDEGYSIRRDSASYIVSAQADRGALYGAYALAASLENNESLAGE